MKRKILRNKYKTPAVDASDDGTRLVFRGRKNGLHPDRRPKGQKLNEWINENK